MLHQISRVQELLSYKSGRRHTSTQQVSYTILYIQIGVCSCHELLGISGTRYYATPMGETQIGQGKTAPVNEQLTDARLV